MKQNNYISQVYFLDLLKDYASRQSETTYADGTHSITVENTLLDRKNAARIVHEFLRHNLREADEGNVSITNRIKDLYDCHTCVGHVAQVYTKGIMEAPLEIFGMGNMVTLEEANQIVARTFFRNLRIKPVTSDIDICDEVTEPQKVTYKDVLIRKKNNAKTRIIDVRTTEEYNKSHLDEAISIPLIQYLKNPYLAADDRFTPVYFYCELAFQSEIAAKLAAEKGYCEVGYFGE